MEPPFSPVQWKKKETLNIGLRDCHGARHGVSKSKEILCHKIPLLVNYFGRGGEQLNLMLFLA